MGQEKVVGLNGQKIPLDMKLHYQMEHNLQKNKFR